MARCREAICLSEWSRPCSKVSVRNTLTSFRPPMVMYANVPFVLCTILTWLVIGPVSSVFSTLKGGRPPKTWVLPVSFKVNQT